ncbi:mechanosensitive ion channel domain-containing protein [Rubripirellula amarantea]|uniref:mechanosensitive ion channel domain-containing protein n=1 Tax=Rubripirellula amarantea TaxID=2527999 RepID=UPI0011B55936|nr:mechanosensitive ion channel domain-containing protein [Rubripirellula amarantea]
MSIQFAAVFLLAHWLIIPTHSSASDSAGTSAEVSAVPALSIEQLERALTELEQSDEISVDVKLQAADNYKAAIKNLTSAAASDARLHALSAEAATVTERVELLKSQRADLKDKKPALESKLTLQELEQLLPTAELQLSTYKKARADAEAELHSRSPRRKEIRERMGAIHEKIADATTQLRSLATAEASPQNHSLTARLASRRITLEKEKPALEAELTLYDAEESADLVRSRIDVASHNAVYYEKLIALLQERINAEREAAAAESVRMARREAIAAAPALKVYAEENQELAEQAKRTAEAIAKAEQDLTAATALHDGLIRQFAQTRKKVDSVGLTSSVGALLRKQITTLPDVNERRRSVANRQALINDTQFKLFEYEEQHQELSLLDGTISTILTAAAKDSRHDVAFLESAARELMVRKREYLDDLVRNTGKYFDKLIELDMVDRQVINLEAEYETYIDQRVLWIRSGLPITEGIHLEASDRWLIQSNRWADSGRRLLNDAKSHPIIYTVFLAIIGLLVARGKALRRLIVDLGLVAKKSNCRSIGPTIRVIFLTSIVSLGLPTLCVFLGWRLQQSADNSEFTLAIGHGFLTLGVLWAAAEWIRQACRSKGLGEAHFDWSPSATSAFRRELRLSTYVALPVCFVTATLASSDGVHERSDIQRIAFVLGMLVVCITVFRLLRPRGVLRDYFVSNQNGMIEKLKYLYPVVGVCVPGSLAALAAAGYFYTAQTLFWRLFATFVFVTTLVVLRSVFFRMLLLRRRHLSMEQARQRAAAAKLASQGSLNPASSNPAGESQAVAGIVTEDKQADISAHSQQSRRLVGSGMMAVAVVGMWMIWIQVLPALSMVGNYSLWGKSTKVASSSQAAMPMMPTTTTGSASAGSTSAGATNTVLDDDSEDSVTIADLALAILIVVVTTVLFRNGPGLLEISVLQQLPLDASVRYAITTLVSYAIVMVGTIAACSTIGLQWSQIQWLATALTFGLAFGLQEMFANFVAGLIILLERPIRVGDIVTVDDVTGVVSRIRIRATSITNWDRKEYVVPNKEFITGRLLNWTLSDKVNRVLIEVGLAYGADTELARSLMLQAANDHPMVLKDPAAFASFEGFGDNALNLRLRAFLPTLDNRLQVITELHTSIDQAFRKAGLEIAFPQRDLHIRTMAKDAAVLLQADTESGEANKSSLADESTLADESGTRDQRREAA